MLSMTLPVERSCPSPLFVLWLIRWGPQAAGAWLTGTSDGRLSVTGLLVYGNHSLKLWHSKFSVVIIAVENRCISISFDSFIFLRSFIFDLWALKMLFAWIRSRVLPHIVESVSEICTESLVENWPSVESIYCSTETVMCYIYPVSMGRESHQGLF